MRNTTKYVYSCSLISQKQKRPSTWSAYEKKLSFYLMDEFITIPSRSSIDLHTRTAYCIHPYQYKQLNHNHNWIYH